MWSLGVTGGKNQSLTTKSVHNGIKHSEDKKTTMLTKIYSFIQHVPTIALDTKSTNMNKI